MLAILLLMLGLVGNVSGQNSPVRFRATVTTDEDHDVIPVCYGDYFVEVAIDEILEDANAVLVGIVSVQVCYQDALALVLGDDVEVYGYYWGGACPKQYCGRVQILDDSYYIMRSEGYGDNDWMVSDGNMYPIPPGNVGIGTPMPQEKLHVVGNVRIEGASPAWLNLVGGLGEDAGMNLTTTGVGVNKWEILRQSTSGDLLIRETFPYPPFSGATLRVKAGSGNVGIGTKSPSEKLHVVGKAIIEAEPGAGFGAPLRVEKDGAGRQLAAFFNNPRDGASEVEIQMGIGKMLPSAWSLKAASGLFSIANVAVLPPAFNIRNTGNIGIGTTSPETKFHLYKGAGGGSNPLSSVDPLVVESDNNAYINVITPNNKWGGILFSDEGRDRGAIRYNHSDDKMDFRTASTTRMAIDSSGRFGIGTTSPKQKLDVDGKVRIRSFETSGGSYDVRVQSDGDLVRAISSRRYKEDVRDLEVDFQKVLKLRPVRFKWRETAEEDVGLIAEEVDEAMEDLVVCDAEGRPDAVRYDKLGVYLLAVVKEQQQIIAELQDRIAPLEELRAQNSSLAQRVKALESTIQQYQFAVAKEVQE